MEVNSFHFVDLRFVAPFSEILFFFSYFLVLPVWDGYTYLPAMIMKYKTFLF